MKNRKEDVILQENTYKQEIQEKKTGNYRRRYNNKRNYEITQEKTE
jgi:hypothetical protein